MLEATSAVVDDGTKLEASVGVEAAPSVVAVGWIVVGEVSASAVDVGEVSMVADAATGDVVVGLKSLLLAKTSRSEVMFWATLNNE